MKHSVKNEGFTLVEILIVVAIIGILAGFGIPSILAANRQSRSKILISDIRTASSAFTQYFFDNNHFPSDKGPTQMPTGMSEYLSKFPWSEKTSVGGNWDWDYGVYGVTAAVSVHQPFFSTEDMQKIDSIIDDGSLNSGTFRIRPGGYMYVIEENPE